MQRRQSFSQRETCCMICDLRIGIIVLAIMGMVETGQQIVVSLALSVAYFPMYADFPSSSISMLHVYTAFQIVTFIIITFGLLAVTTQGRHYRNALLLWIAATYVISVMQIIYLFYVVAYFNRRTFSMVAVTLVVVFVPKNSFFTFIVYRYYKLLNVGFYTPDYDELELTAETWRRSRAGSSRRDSIRTSKEMPLLGMQDIASKSDSNLRKLSTNFSLKVIPELSESKDSSEGNAEECSSIKTM